MEPASKRDIRCLAMAAGVALTSKCRFKHGAIVVKSGRVLGASPNLWRNDPRVDHVNASIHAEIAALRKAGWPRRATVYVARISRNGKAARLSKPCANCQAVLDELKCRVVFSESE